MKIKLVACICCAALTFSACIGSNENVSKQSDLSSEAIQSTLAETETPVYEFTEATNWWQNGFRNISLIRIALLI